jgi:hypothetical protein
MYWTYESAKISFCAFNVFGLVKLLLIWLDTELVTKSYFTVSVLLEFNKKFENRVLTGAIGNWSGTDFEHNVTNSFIVKKREPAKQKTKNKNNKYN